MSKQKYVWCMVPPSMQGNKLLSLAGLRDVAPDVAAAAEKKYDNGRESHKSATIPCINAKWDEIIFLSPFHPYEIHKAYQDAGFDPSAKKYFQIPIERLHGMEAAVIFPQLPNETLEENLNKARLFHPDTDLPAALPEIQKQSYKIAHDSGITPLILGRSPHIALKAKAGEGLDVGGLEIIDCSYPVDLPHLHAMKSVK